MPCAPIIPGRARARAASAAARLARLLLGARVAGLLLGRRYLAHREASGLDLLLHRFELLGLLGLFPFAGRLGRHMNILPYCAKLRLWPQPQDRKVRPTT